jgi:hypothetical protein
LYNFPIKWLEHNSAADLRGDKLGQPSRTASTGAADKGAAMTSILVNINVEIIADLADRFFNNLYTKTLHGTVGRRSYDELELHGHLFNRSAICLASG